MTKSPGNETGVREQYAAAICDGFTNGNVEYVNEPDNRKLSYQMAADAVLALAPQPPKAETPAGVGDKSLIELAEAFKASCEIRERLVSRVVELEAALSIAPAARAGDGVEGA